MPMKKFKKQKPTQQKYGKPNTASQFEYDEDIRIIPLCSDYHLENIVRLESSPSPDSLIMTPDDHVGCRGWFYEWNHLQYLLATEGISVPCDECSNIIDWSQTVKKADPNARICHCPRLCLNRFAKSGKIYASCPVRMGSRKRCCYFEWI